MNHTVDYAILAGVYILSITGFLFIHRKKPLEAQAVFFCYQLLTWILGLIVVENGLIRYPVKEFRIATNTSFVFEYLAFPVVACYFNIFYPRDRGVGWKIIYYSAFALGITIPEQLIRKYTQLIEYVHWNWYWTFISVWLSLYVSQLFFRWFFSDRDRANKTAGPSHTHR